MLVYTQILALPVCLPFFDCVLKHGRAHVDDHISAGIDEQPGQVLLVGQFKADLDVHHGNHKAKAHTLAQHGGEYAAVGTGALVEGFFRGALLGHQLAAEGQRRRGVLAEHEGGPLRLVGLGGKQLLPLPLEDVYVSLLAGGGGPVLIHLVEAGAEVHLPVAVVAHQQVRQVLPLGVLDPHLDLELIVVQRGVDHVIFLVHDVLCFKGHHVDVGIAIGVAYRPAGGVCRCIVDGRQGVGEHLALFKVHVLDDVVLEALGGGVHPQAQVHHVEFIRSEQVDRQHHRAVLVGMVAEHRVVVIQDVIRPHIHALHGHGRFLRARLEHDGHLVFGDDGDLRVRHVVGRQARRAGQPVGPGGVGRDPGDRCLIRLRIAGFAKQGVHPRPNRLA